MKYISILYFSFLLFLPCRAQTEVIKDNSTYGITLSFPWINYYHYIDYNKKTDASSFGFLGFGFSGYYKHGKGKTSFNISTTEDLPSPISTINYQKKDIKTGIGSNYFELIYHHKLNEDLNIVGGFNFTNYIFRLESQIKSISSYTKEDQTLGLSMGIEYRFNNYYSVLGMYRPAISSFETDNKYRHLINIELRIDLDFKKLKCIK